MAQQPSEYGNIEIISKTVPYVDKVKNVKKNTGVSQPR
jgi:hypothetical protein